MIFAFQFSLMKFFEIFPVFFFSLILPVQLSLLFFPCIVPEILYFCFMAFLPSGNYFFKVF